MVVLGSLSGEGLDVGDGLPKDEGVDILERGQAGPRGCNKRTRVCSFIGIRNLQICDMPTNVILIRSSISTKNVQ